MRALCCLVICWLSMAPAHSEAIDSRVLADRLGLEVQVEADGVARASWPRQDLSVRVDGMVLHPAQGLTSWAAFKPTKHGTMVMSDTVVLEDESDAAIDAALESGLSVTALHNHFVFDRPLGDRDSAVVSGDFAMLAREVQPVLKVLRKSNIHVVALHNHMIGEKPAYYFLHFWGKDEPLQLARGLRGALDAQAHAR